MFVLCHSAAVFEVGSVKCYPSCCSVRTGSVRCDTIMYVSIRFEGYRLVLSHCCVFVSFFVLSCFLLSLFAVLTKTKKIQVKRLDGLVRTLALYGILERNVMDSSK